MSPAPAQASRRGENHQKTMEIHRRSSKIMFFFTNFVWTVLHHYLELGAGIWTGAKRDSEFSFSEEKKWSKKIRSKINFGRKKFGRKFFGRQKILVDKMFGRQKKLSIHFLVDIFSAEKNLDWKKMKFFKINFLHEKLIFFGLFFFSCSVWLRSFDFYHLLEYPIHSGGDLSKLDR